MLARAAARPTPWRASGAPAGSFQSSAASSAPRGPPSDGAASGSRQRPGRAAGRAALSTRLSLSREGGSAAVRALALALHPSILLSARIGRAAARALAACVFPSLPRRRHRAGAGSLCTTRHPPKHIWARAGAFEAASAPALPGPGGLPVLWSRSTHRTAGRSPPAPSRNLAATSGPPSAPALHFHTRSHFFPAHGATSPRSRGPPLWPDTQYLRRASQVG